MAYCWHAGRVWCNLHGEFVNLKWNGRGSQIRPGARLTKLMHVPLASVATPSMRLLPRATTASPAIRTQDSARLWLSIVRPPPVRIRLGTLTTGVQCHYCQRLPPTHRKGHATPRSPLFTPSMPARCPLLCAPCSTMVLLEGQGTVLCCCGLAANSRHRQCNQAPPGPSKS